MSLARSRKPKAAAVFSGSGAYERDLPVIEGLLDGSALPKLAGLTTFEADLVLGVNRLSHRTGRAPSFVMVAPLGTANAAFAWRWIADGSNPSPREQVWLEVAGVAQRARVLVL